MTEEELEKLYMDIYDNGFVSNEYKEKFKRYVNTRIEQLEAQTEKMKCCYNCKHSRTDYEHCKTDKHEKWEIKENE